MCLQDVFLFGRADFRRLIINNPSWPDPYLGGDEQILVTPAIVRAAADLRSPYTLHYTLAIEHKLTERTTASATWTRFRGVSLFRSRDVNAPLYPTWSRPDPSFGIIRQIESSGPWRARASNLVLRPFDPFFTGSVRYELGRVMSNMDSVDRFRRTAITSGQNGHDRAGTGGTCCARLERFVYVIGFRPDSYCQRVLALLTV